jgi:hypothetical protein
MGDVPGFVAHDAFDAGDGVVASVSVFPDLPGVGETKRKRRRVVASTLRRVRHAGIWP